MFTTTTFKRCKLTITLHLKVVDVKRAPSLKVVVVVVTRGKIAVTSVVRRIPVCWW